MGNNEANPSAQGPTAGYPLPSYLQPYVPGPCPGFLPPFVCPFGLATNRLLAKYNAPAAGGVGPQGGNLYGETLLLEETGTGNYNGLLARRSISLPITSPPLRTTRGRTAFPTITQPRSVSSSPRRPCHSTPRRTAAIVRTPTRTTYSTNL